MRDLLILGLGNDILRDDAIGLRVARRLAAELGPDSTIDVRETTEMGLVLLDYLAGYARAFVVDAIITGSAAPGFLHELSPSALRTLTNRTPHFLGVAETLALGRELGLEMPSEVRVFAVEVEDPFRLGTEMTPALEAALPGIVGRIAEVAEEVCQATGA